MNTLLKVGPSSEVMYVCMYLCVYVWTVYTMNYESVWTLWLPHSSASPCSRTGSSTGSHTTIEGPLVD